MIFHVGGSVNVHGPDGGVEADKVEIVDGCLQFVNTTIVDPGGLCVIEHRTVLLVAAGSWTWVRQLHNRDLVVPDELVTLRPRKAGIDDVP